MEEPNASAANMREARIQEELNTRRSGSMRSLSSRSLSEDEEAELEGKAGDSGLSSVEDPETLTVEDGSSGEMARVSNFGVPGANDSKRGQVVPVMQSPSIEQHRSLAPLDKLHSSLEFVSILAYLTTFGILGVIVRYLLEILFGPHVANVTSSKTALFPDLPANMLGSFFMGWVGVVFKQDIAHFSEHLAVGLSTGLMGSITTYASMVQRLLAVMVAGHWVGGIVGLTLGLELAQMSLVVGVDSARLLRRILERVNANRARKGLKKLKNPSPDNLCRRKIGLALFAILGGGLWIVAGLLTFIDKKPKSRRTLWLACLVAPPGVWIRWYLARLNGRGIGPQHKIRWFPVGTFLVNVGASSLEAGLSTGGAVANRYTATLLVSSLQLGFLGCMSTVSTFAAEIQIMHQGRHAWRAYAYPAISLFTSFVIGFLIYGVPLWVFGYEYRY